MVVRFLKNLEGPSRGPLAARVAALSHEQDVVLVTARLGGQQAHGAIDPLKPDPRHLWVMDVTGHHVGAPKDKAGGHDLVLGNPGLLELILHRARRLARSATWTIVLDDAATFANANPLGALQELLAGIRRNLSPGHEVEWLLSGGEPQGFLAQTRPFVDEVVDLLPDGRVEASSSVPVPS